jgi:hypothetical protein
MGFQLSSIIVGQASDRCTPAFGGMREPFEFLYIRGDFTTFLLIPAMLKDIRRTITTLDITIANTTNITIDIIEGKPWHS